MLFSCCCARISRAWRTVCDCYTGRDYQCDAHCLEDALLETELYYDHALVSNTKEAEVDPRGFSSALSYLGTL